VHSQGRSFNVRTFIMTEGHETVDFKLHFQHWSTNVEIKLYEAGREKVAGVRTMVILSINCFHLEHCKSRDRV
jgi:advillin